MQSKEQPVVETTPVKEQVELYDVVIVGAGIAGLTAALHCALKGRRCLLVDGLIFGGKLNTAGVVKAWPGDPELNGVLFAQKIMAQIESLVIIDKTWGMVMAIKVLEDTFITRLDNGKLVRSRSIIYAVGVNNANKPNTSLVDKLVALTEDGYILAGEDTCTSQMGLFAAGDVRHKPCRALVSAAADGAAAADQADRYLQKTLVK